MKVLYPTSIELDIESLVGFSVTLHPYNVKVTIPEELVDAEIMITWINSAENLKDAARRMKNLRWIQALAAGPNDVLNAGFDSKIIITTGSGTHDNTVAEHTLGMILCGARRFYEMRDYQLQSKWPGHLGGSFPRGGKFTTLRGARVLIWGFGGIAQTLTPLLSALGARVRGVARSSGVRSGIEVLSQDRLPELLAQTDVLVMILPGSEQTRKALNAERLKLLPEHAWVINVGRGMSVDEDALVGSLEKGEIGGAALDVFETEPLPASSLLWKAPNLIISPHAAGGRPEGCTDLIAENLRRFLAGRPLENAIKLS